MFAKEWAHSSDEHDAASTPVVRDEHQRDVGDRRTRLDEVLDTAAGAREVGEVLVGAVDARTVVGPRPRGRLIRLRRPRLSRSIKPISTVWPTFKDSLNVAQLRGRRHVLRAGVDMDGIGGKMTPDRRTPDS